MTIRILVNGASGKMGQLACAALSQAADLQLVATTGRADPLVARILESKADVVLDLTSASAVFENAKAIILSGARPVIGTSGLRLDQIEALKPLLATHAKGGLIVPNFSIGAILMMRFAKAAAAYFQHAEIVEMHHLSKVDAPSGTARKTAECIAEGNPRINAEQKSSPSGPDAARGHLYQRIPIHSLRLPGYVAHQEVIFGQAGETLTLRHDCNDRQALMPGLLLACRSVTTLNSLVYGLDALV